MNITFEKKVAIITGATSGIGEATAGKMLAAGASIVITGRNAKKLTELANSLTPSENVLALAGDLSSAEFRTTLIIKTIETFGRLDILINAAGIIANDSATAGNMELYDQVMDVNVRSIFHLSSLAIPYLAESQGNIVNVSSVAGTRAFPGIVSYCVSKAALDQLTRCSALELAPKGIRVNAVNPGVVETRLHLNSGMSAEAYQQFLERSKETHPIGRVGQATEVADLILFLASTAAGWVTGACYAIDGGRAETCAR